MQTKLEAIADFTNGGAWNQTEYSNEGVPVVRVTDIKDETVDLSDCRFLPKSAAGKYAKHLLRAGDLVICTVGSHPTQPGSVVGRAAIMPDAAHGALLNQNAVLIRSSSPDVDQGWLGYLGRSRNFHDYIISCARGSANQVRMSIGLLREMPVEVPPLPVQQRIAGILSAYDELIGNSQQRIRILEAMARALYSEWFVHFRFPGHEKLPRVASPLGDIPQGWEVKSLESLIADHIGGGWGKEIGDEDHTEPAWVIRGTDIPDARSCQVADVPHRFHSVSNIRSRRLQAGDILFEVSGGSKGQPVGRTLLVTPQLMSAFDDDAVICASFCKRVRPDAGGYGSELLFLSFLEGYESGEIEQFQVQSTGISNFKWTEYIAKTERVIPPEPLRVRFRDRVAPMFSQIAMLGLKIQNLRRTRDLLLPRLLAGQLHLEISS
jgi:type I restriction enzyme S subunit